MAGYYYLTSYLVVGHDDDEDGKEIHEKRKEVGNTFETYEEAEHASKIIKVSRYINGDNVLPEDNE